MSIWKWLFGKTGQPSSREVKSASGARGAAIRSPANQVTNDPLSRMGTELKKATSSNSIEGVIIDAYPAHEMSCPVHGGGGVNIITGEKKHQFRITGDRVVCTSCGATAINPSRSSSPWTGVANNTNLQIIIAHRQALLKAFASDTRES